MKLPLEPGHRRELQPDRFADHLLGGATSDGRTEIDNGPLHGRDWKAVERCGVARERRRPADEHVSEALRSARPGPDDYFVAAGPRPDAPGVARARERGEGLRR